MFFGFFFSPSQVSCSLERSTDCKLKTKSMIPDLNSSDMCIALLHDEIFLTGLWDNKKRLYWASACAVTAMLELKPRHDEITFNTRDLPYITCSPKCCKCNLKLSPLKPNCSSLRTAWTHVNCVTKITKLVLAFVKVQPSWQMSTTELHTQLSTPQCHGEREWQGGKWENSELR